MVIFWNAEAASCRSAIRTARGVVADIGSEAAKRSGGLSEVAKINERTSERDLLNLTGKKYLLSLPISLSTLQKSKGVRYTGDFHAIRLRDWIQFFINFGCWHVLCGLANPNEKREQDILLEFWRLYKLWRPDHEIWGVVESKQINLSRTVPMICHGDEGRGYKKSGFLVCCYHSYLGKGTHLANESRTKRPYLSMKLNYSGSSWSHRFITAVLPKMFKDEKALDDVLTFMTEDILDVINNGVVDSAGRKCHAIVLQFAGDWQWLVKSGKLARSYSNCEKRPRAENAFPRGICHYCRAGQRDVPFEDFRGNAFWRTTEFERDDAPFLVRPQALAIPHEPRAEPRFFVFDIFHCYHLGLGKTFLGAVLALISEKMDGGNIDERMGNLTDLYLQFCEDHHITPYILVISKDTIQWPDKGSFPNGNWSKGHVTTTLTKFVRWYLTLHDWGDPLLEKCREASILISDAMHLLYSSDLWLPKTLANDIGMKGRQFLMKYQELASICYHSGRALFIFMPKAHACDHTFSELATCTAPFAMNPLAHGVQVDEDMVGRVSRVSRRVHPTQVIKRVLERAFHASFAAFVECGYLKSRWQKWSPGTRDDQDI